MVGHRQQGRSGLFAIGALDIDESFDLQLCAGSALNVSAGLFGNGNWHDSLLLRLICKQEYDKPISHIWFDYSIRYRLL